MKTFSLLLAVLALTFAFDARAQSTREVLVLSTDTTLTRTAGTNFFEVLNLGPYTIWCNLGTAAVVNKGRKIVSGGAWHGPAPSTVAIHCIASTASQLTTAATIFSESNTK